MAGIGKHEGPGARHDLVELELDEISAVDEPDNEEARILLLKRRNDGQGGPAELELQGRIEKVVPERRMAFGWAYVAVDKDGTRQRDHSGDDLDPLELEPAAYDFAMNARRGGEMHVRKDPNGAEHPIATLVESLALTPEKAAAIGIPPGVLPERAWWVGFEYHDEQTWQAVKSGRYPAFSIGGRAQRRAQETPTRKARMTPTLKTRGDVVAVATGAARNIQKQHPGMSLEAARAQVWEDRPDLRQAYEAAPESPAGVLQQGAAPDPVVKGADVLQKHSAAVDALRRSDTHFGKSEATLRQIAWDQNPELQEQYRRAVDLAG